MGALTKQQSKAHAEALALVRSGRPLSEDEKVQVLRDFHPAGSHLNRLAGAFFTPGGLARDVAIEIPSGARIVDLCAGIGALAFALREHAQELTCVEINPDYVEVGRAVVPEATWICADIGDVATWASANGYDVAVSNPPFGRIPISRKDLLYRGGEFEYHAIEVAAQVAKYGVFILPQTSAPFEFSGKQSFRERPSEKYRSFVDATGIELEPSCGIDTHQYRHEWPGTSPVVEVVTADIGAYRRRTAPQLALSLAA